MALTGLEDDDEPFDARDDARMFFGELLYKGPLNKMLNVEVSTRASLANGLVFRDDPQGVAQNGYVATAIKQASGPLGSYAMGLERGVAAMNQGEFWRGVEAFLPSFARNGLKSVRYGIEGATTLKGQPVDTDINLWNNLMQVVGFAPADLSSTYEQRNAAANRQNKILARKTKLLNRLDIARQTGDSKLVRDTMRDINSFGRAYPGLIQPNTVSRSYKARRAAERKLVDGMRFNDTLLESELRPRYFQD